MKKKVILEFTKEDACEIYFIIKSRGESEVRRKLLWALSQLDLELAKRAVK